MPSSTESVESVPTSSTAKEIVSQSEIEQLLAQVGSVDLPPQEAGQPFPTGSAGTGVVRRHEFPKISFYSSADLRRLRMRHEDFISSLAARLSIHLGMELAMQMSKLDTMRFQNFVDSLSNPTYLTMLKLQPLAGVALLDIPPRVGLCLVDRELGGPGRAADETAQIGKIEAGLLNRIADLIIQEWCNVWSDHLEIHATVSGTESNSRFLSTSTPDTNMLVVGVEFRLGDIVEPMQFAFPHPMLEPLTAKLGAGTNSADAPGLPLKTAPAKWNSFLDELPLELQAEIPEIELPASQVAELKPGDVLTLPSDLMSQIKLRIANHPGFVGSLGEASQHRAIRIEKAVGV